MSSGGAYPNTSVKEIIASGVPSNKITIAKLATNDTGANGFVDSQQLGQFVNQANTNFNWYGGIALWKYASDFSGQAIKNAIGNLTIVCSSANTCK
jgi:hypothetical protein